MRRDNIHSFFGVPSHGATQGYSNYVSRCVEASSIHPHSCRFIHTFTSLSILIYFSSKWKCPMPVQKCRVTFRPPCICDLIRPKGPVHDLIRPSGKQNFEKNPEMQIWVENLHFEFLLDFGRKTPKVSYSTRESLNSGEIQLWNE